MDNWGWREKQSFYTGSEQTMTLEQFTATPHIELSLQKVQAQQKDAEHRVQELLSDIKQMLTLYQSDFTWR